MLEIGANIGACTVELLLRTKARVIAFEPSSTNLFYLTRSLRLVAQSHPEIARRVVVFPIAAGDQQLSRAPLFAERGNLGNTIIGRPFSDACAFNQTCLAESMRAGQHATVEPLDAIFSRGLGATRLVKLDTQGFECKVMAGARRALRSSHAVQAIVAEVSPVLHAHCCFQSNLIGRMRLDETWEVGCTPHLTCISRRNGSVGMARAYLERRVRPRGAAYAKKIRDRMERCERAGQGG